MSLRLAWVFLYLGLVSFGGGLAVVPEMHRQLVDAGWLNESVFSDGYAIGQLAPGPNMLSIVFYGFRTAGPCGALVATVATFGPGIVGCAALGRFLARERQHWLLERVRDGLVPVGIGLMAAGVLVVGRGVVRVPAEGVVALLVALTVGRRLLSPALAVVIAGVVGGLVLR